LSSFGPPDRGTALTLRYCQAEYKPTLVIDAGATPVEMATVLLAVFVTRHGIKTLNVAGPRASKQPKVYGYVLRLVVNTWRLLRKATGTVLEVHSVAKESAGGPAVPRMPVQQHVTNTDEVGLTRAFP